MSGNGAVRGHAREPSGHLWPSHTQLRLLEAATGQGPKAVEAYRQWRSGVDLDAEFGWEILRLLPLVYHNLHAQGFDEPLMGRLKGVYRRAWVENHQLFHAARPAVEALTRRGTGVLLLKGAPLVLEYYRNHALRPMADVDLAVRRSDAPEAAACLSELGWRFGRPVDPDLLRFHNAVRCFGPGGAELDLHWHVTYEACTEGADDELWDRSEPLDFLGIPVRQLDPTALLLHTVIHGLRWNRETPIRWIPDALTILRRRGDEVDWETLEALALGLEVPVRLRMGLEFLVSSFGAPVPAPVLARLPCKAVSLRERIDNSVLLSDPSFYEGSALRWQWVLFTEFYRRYWATGPLDLVSGFSHFIRFRWGLDGRREIVPTALRALGRRVVTRGTPTPPASTPGEAGTP